MYGSLTKRHFWFLQGVQLANEHKNGRFAFVNGLGSSGSVVDLCQDVRTAVETAGPGAVLVLDDVSALLWLGNQTGDVVRAVTSLRALVSDVSRFFATSWTWHSQFSQADAHSYPRTAGRWSCLCMRTIWCLLARRTTRSCFDERCKCPTCGYGRLSCLLKRVARYVKPRHHTRSARIDVDTSLTALNTPWPGAR